MSRIYNALKRAEHEHQSASGVGPHADRHAGPAIAWDIDDDARLEYERLQVWIANRSHASRPNQALMIAACRRGHGATTTATGIALTLAQRPTAQVLVVDANLRTPCLHRLFGASERHGFRELLANGGNGGDCVQATTQPNLFVMTTGQLSRSPLEALSPSDVGRLVTQLKSRFEFVVFDVAPLLEFPDAYTLAPHVDAVLLVVEADRTLVDDGRRVMRELERAGVSASGVILNRQRDYTPRLLRRVLHRRNGSHPPV